MPASPKNKYSHGSSVPVAILAFAIIIFFYFIGRYFIIFLFLYISKKPKVANTVYLSLRSASEENLKQIAAMEKKKPKSA